ncbi:NUDIX hydrolase [Alkaliphilus sp. B6464]|uniref:NUDIX hydrolase n=1 Tax=Alkaliphilus sp. B6464 TaxID=2731219 RepID=UPI001BA55648|nr:NUDIX hydrolase [Alkaliphilus sp. B6464]QUH21936.1 NUDIX hydrolase [Alkaliphilus sp. B6464]
MNNEIRNANGLTEQEFIDTYDAGKYNDNKPSVTSDVLIFTVQSQDNAKDFNNLNDKKLKILMVQRGDFPDINKWALPGGFIEKGETSLQAAERELQEETGIEEVYLEQLYTWDNIGRDIRDRVISISHIALVDSTELEIKAGSDAKDARWFGVDKKITRIDKQITENGYIKHKYIDLCLINEDIKIKGEVRETITVKGRARKVKLEVLNKKNSQIAFDHAMMIYYGLQRLKNKVEYTDIAFNLLPELFTIAEAHKIFELTTGIEYTNQNFRKRFDHMMIETNETSKKYSPRPAKLYKLNINWDDEE